MQVASKLAASLARERPLPSVRYSACCSKTAVVPRGIVAQFIDRCFHGFTEYREGTRLRFCEEKFREGQGTRKLPRENVRGS